MARIHAPELTPAQAWVNTGRPLTLAELRGQLVVLDFWTSCCVNCMHVAPVLAELEARFAHEPLVVLGVHSAKFTAEAAPQRVADAARRLGIRHPVAVDDGLALWERFGVRSWPTLVVVRPDGTIAAVAPGEPDPAVLGEFVRAQLEEGRRNGSLAARPFVVPPAPPAGWIGRAASATPTHAPGTLAYPGKLAVHPDGCIAVADPGHHRVLVLAPTGDVLHVVGSGEPGHADGPFATARLDEPQGLAWDGDVLWLCDVRTHVLARADLAYGTVTTVAGTGEMGTLPLGEPRPGRSVALRSPWDVVVDGSRLYLALAGSHQLGVFDQSTGTVGLLSGTSREALVDGPPAEACFAQPSGLWLEGRTLWIADSEVSAVRALDLTTGTTSTLVGRGLFDFGLEDGPLESASLQHPLAVLALNGRRLLVADTYNDVLRLLDRDARTLRTVYRGEGAAALHEPSGLARLADGSLLVADTNHHRLVRLSASFELQGELTIAGAPPPPPDRARAPRTRAAPTASVRWFELAAASEEPLGDGAARLALTLAAPLGWKLDAGAPVRVALEVSRRSDLFVPRALEHALRGRGEPTLALEVVADVGPTAGESVPSELLVTVDAILCRAGDAGVCVPARGWYRIPVTLGGAGHALEARLELAAPEGV
jgi:thiol-disulfide isomerase/thioredoxin